MDPEAYLAGLAPVGWRLGLERMQALCAVLGEPQRAYESLHVVGTNGKSSVAVMASEILEEAGLRTGVCLSPHTVSWRERTRIGGAEIAAGPFAAAVAAVAEAIPAVEGRLGEDQRVTQFEAAVAASFVAFREAGIDVAVVEAGLGGRLDATNVIPSRATALTSVALDHTDWLGETLTEIATEKLAVLREGTTLVVGALQPPVGELAERTARERSAALVRAAAPPVAASPDLAPYLRRNAGVAIGLVRVLVPDLDADRASGALRLLRLPGRAELVGSSPPLIADVAHNEEGARALAEALPVLAGGRPVVACLSVLADKDAAGIAAALGPLLDEAVCTAADPGPAMGRPGAAALEPERLAAELRGAGCRSEAVADPAAAVLETVERARAKKGVALCAGSHYLLRYAWIARHAQSSSR